MHLSSVIHRFTISPQEAAMSKKGKKACALEDDFGALIELVPKLEAFIKAHKDISAGYLKYRKNGGEAIPGIEKHLGIKEHMSAPSVKTQEAETKTEAKTPKEGTVAKK